MPCSGIHHIGLICWGCGMTLIPQVIRSVVDDKEVTEIQIYNLHVHVYSFSNMLILVMLMSFDLQSRGYMMTIDDTFEPFKPIGSSITLASLHSDHSFFHHPLSLKIKPSCLWMLKSSICITRSPCCSNLHVYQK